MYSENPLLLEMSTRQLLKKRKLYTPEQWRSMMDRLQRIGKNANAPISGLHSADEYGMRMYNGQIKRAFKTANKHDRNLKFDFNGDPNDGYVRHLFGLDKISVSPNQTAQPVISNYDPKLYSRKILRSKLKDTRNMSNNLSLGNVLAHEVDEYSTSLNRARKYGVIPGFTDISGFRSQNVQAVTSSHNPGVLGREAKRQHMLSSLYGRDKFKLWKRDHEQFAKNKPKFVDKNIDIKREIFQDTSDENLVKKLRPQIEKDMRLRADAIADDIYKNTSLDLRTHIKNPHDVIKFKKAIHADIDELRKDYVRPQPKKRETMLYNQIHTLMQTLDDVDRYAELKFSNPLDLYR